MLMGILGQIKARAAVEEEYSVNGLRELSDEIGPKTASCVLALTLGRQRFVVDTHIHRITGMLGWRLSDASPEQTRGHLECRIPDEHKYALHLLFITHGRECPRCRAVGDKSYDFPLQPQIKTKGTRTASTAQLKASLAHES
ncbi:DNA glycosylase [Aspergillus similis]